MVTPTHSTQNNVIFALNLTSRGQF